MQCFVYKYKTALAPDQKVKKANRMLQRLKINGPKAQNINIMSLN